jgi:galactose mutarotase-like enzyme
VTVDLRAGEARLVVDETSGARAASWQVGDLELLGRGDGPVAQTAVGSGMFLMAPWAGRLRDSTLRYGGASYPMPVDGTGWALHGTVLARPWTVDVEAPDHVELSVPLEEPWPWPGTVRATWRLRPDRLEASIVVEAATVAFPASAGWHPWFRRSLGRGDPLVVDVPGSTMLERGADHLPTGRVLEPRPAGPYDDTFPLPGGTTTLAWPGALRLECRSDCRYAVLFDENAGAVCLEPQSAPPDGLNTAPDLVFPGRPLTARAEWSWSSVPG